MKRTHKGEFSWPKSSMQHVLQCNGSVKDRFCLQKGKNYYPQVYVEESKYTNPGNRQ